MVYHMTKKDRRNWEINLENHIAEATEKPGSAVVQAVLRRYDAHGLWDLNPCYYAEVFFDLQQIICDWSYHFPQAGSITAFSSLSDGR